MNLFKNRSGLIYSKATLGAIIVILLMIIGIMSIALIIKVDCPECKCPSCPPCDIKCPDPECPACLCSPNITTECPIPNCPRPVCPEYCNLTEEQINQITNNISETKCYPSNLQKVGLFSIIMALFSVLIALVDTKNRIVSIICFLAYIVILAYLAIIRYYDYAIYGFFIILAVSITRLFIKDSEGK